MLSSIGIGSGFLQAIPQGAWGSRNGSDGIETPDDVLAPTPAATQPPTAVPVESVAVQTEARVKPTRPIPTYATPRPEAPVARGSSHAAHAYGQKTGQDETVERALALAVQRADFRSQLIDRIGDAGGSARDITIAPRAEQGDALPAERELVYSY